MNIQTIELDISKEGIGYPVKIAQGDVHGTTIKALLYDNGSELDLTECDVYLLAKLPDRKHYARLSCTVSGNVATCVIDEEKIASVYGYTDEVYFTVRKGDDTYSTNRFALDIARSAIDGQVPAESWDNAVDNLIKRGEAAVNSANTAASAANDAASAASAAASAANDAASAANTAASAANDAAAAANDAKTNADKAASAATTAAALADQATKNANDATQAATEAAESANGAAISANAAAATAQGAADGATAAAQNAMNIANSISSIKPPAENELQELRDANDVLAHAVAELQDGYVYFGETLYVPSSRVSGQSGETLTLSQSSVSDEIATLN